MQDFEKITKSRIGQRLKETALSARQASIQAGMNPDTLGKYLLGKTRSLKANNFSALARVLGVNESWLLGTSDEPADTSNDKPFGVRFGGIVEAGAFRPENHFNQDAEHAIVPLPPDARYPLSAQYAFQVMGDSMTRERIFEGMHVLAVSLDVWERLHGAPGDGRLVVVARQRNGHAERELTVKKLRLFMDRFELQPASDNPVHQPLVFPLPLREADEGEAHIIAVVLAATWIYT
jgi:SOS-response transcriptional repressor LexA